MRTESIQVTDQKNNELLGLILVTVLCGFMLMLRMAHKENIQYMFFVWNLFLAWVPLIFAVAGTLTHSKWLKYSSYIVWLLFLPNAPYIITDLIHLQQRCTGWWYDSALFFVFAFAGLHAGLYSMKLVHEDLAVLFSPKTSWLVMGGVCVAVGYGLYLGRNLRLNSWDVVTAPSHVISQLQYSLSDNTAYYMTFLYAALMGATYLMSYIRGN